MRGVGRIAGRGAGDGDLPPLKVSRAISIGDPVAAVDEKEERREEGLLLGGFMLDSGVAGTDVLALEMLGAAMTGSGNSDIKVAVDPASETVEERLAIDGLFMLKDGAREFLISITA